MTAFDPITPDQLRRQREIARRKKYQSAISTGSAALGLGGLGITAASLVAGKKPRLLGIKPQNAKKARNTLKNTGIYTTIGSTGAGSGSSLYFAGTQRRESQLDSKVTNTQQRMSNKHAVGKSMSEIAEIMKARESIAVPRGTQAWGMADSIRDQRWRDYVSEGALRGYGANAAGRRRHAQGTAGIAVGTAIGGAGAAGLLTGVGSPKRLGIFSAPLLVGTGVGAWGARRRSSGREAVLRSHKIKARGYQRMLDEERVGKAWRLPSLVRTPPKPGRPMKLVLRNPSFARRAV